MTNISTKKSYRVAESLIEGSRVEQAGNKMTDAMETADKIYEVVVRLVEENRVGEAIGKITETEDKIRQLRLLSKLAHSLAYILGREFALTSHLDLGRIDSLSRDLENTLIRASILANAFSNPDTNDPANEFIRLHISSNDLSNAYVSARATAHDLAKYLTHVRDINLAYAERLNSVILGVLESKIFGTELEYGMTQPNIIEIPDEVVEPDRTGR